MAAQTSSPPASPNARANYAVDERSFNVGNGSSAREVSPGYPSPPASPPHTASAKGSMGPPASGARGGGAQQQQAGYASMTGAGAALQQGSSGAHPPSKSATGGQSHAHRPVSAMPTPSSRHVVPPSPSSRQTANSGNEVLASMNAGASYNERRASAHPTMSSSQTSNGVVLPAMPGGVDSQVAANAISSGIPITSPAALSYFAAHPRRQQVHFGSYLLLQTLGEGEFGKVKLGVHKEWGEEVAVKLIKRDKVATPDAQLALNEPKDPSKMSKVEREIQVLKDVRHPNIVRLYEVIESDRYIGIVLEYASGGELFDHILAHKYLKERDACRLFAQLISGVSYLHQKKIVHRDLKLENLLLDRNRNVIITDFGFANNFEDRRDDLMATSCGSPCYAAPELVVQDGLYAGSAVDVWSCGVILYAMLAGYLPFDDDPANPDGDNINLLYKYIMATPLSFPEYITAEPRDLLSKMLVPDPLRRIDLVGVMAHSWLAPYRDLFKFSVDELERAAIEQQSKKRQVYRQQMQVQQQLQEQQRSQGVTRSGSRSGGDASARGGAAQAGPTDAATKAQRHQSAVVSSATTADRWHEPVASASGRSRPVTGVPQPANAPPVPVLPAMTLAPQSDAALGGDASHTTASYRSSVGGASTRKREPESTPPSSKKTPSAQKSQRHTIQLEYDESTRQGAAPRGASAAAPPPVPRVERQSSGPAPEPVVVPAVPVVVPAAERKASASMGRSSTGPVQTAPSPIAEARSPTTPTAAADTSAPPSSFRQPSASPGGGRTGSTRVASNPPPIAQQSEDVAFPLPGDRTASGGAGPKPDANSRTKVPSSVERANSRHRKGMSTDKFFSRLLGSGPSAEAPSTPGGADAAGLAASPSTPGDESKSSTGRRKTMSLVVGGRGDTSSVASRDREKAQQATASKAAKEERRLTGRARKDTLQRPETPRQQTASSVASQASPGTANGSVRTKASRRQNGLFDEGANESSSTVGPSSNAAKKVMDWFRKKSLSRGNFSEQPPLGPFERPSQAGSVASRAPSAVADGAEAPRVVVTGANGASAVPAGELESMPSSRSTSGTHSQTSQATDTTGVTSYEGSDVGLGIKSTGASTVQLDTGSQQTPTASSTRVNGLPSPTTPTTGLPPSLATSPALSSAPFTNASLRYHLGAVDQSALTSRPPREVFAEVRKVLFEMGVEARKEREEEFKLECVRRKRTKTLTQGIGISIRSSVFPPKDADVERIARSPPMPDGGAPTGPGGSIRNFLRRGSAQPTNTLSSNASTGRPGTAVSGEDAAALPPTLYGDVSVDPGHEVRFTVEVTQLKNLPGLYSVDIRRLKGGIWAYKFIYHSLLERCQLNATPTTTPRAVAAA